LYCNISKGNVEDGGVTICLGMKFGG